MTYHQPGGAGPRTKICTSLSGRTCAELARKAGEAFAQGTDLVEFRLDLLRPPDFEKIRAALSMFVGRSILAVRSASEGGGFEGKESERVALISSLRELRPAYLDVELETLEANPSVAKGLKNVIVSWHDLRRTPDRATLLSVIDRAASYGGLVKVVATANDAVDNLTVLSLYDEPGVHPVAFCMGAPGVFSRVMAMELGSPLAYASLASEPTAPGQLTLGATLAVRRRLQGA